MSLMIVQLNHPGPEKEFKPFNNSSKISDGYVSLANAKIIREWNNDKCHYRKFIKNKGFYISELTKLPNAQPEELLFWGEWEGNSFFNVIGSGKGTPNGIHEPFHSIVNRGHQNTDPYVYGEYFKYAVCSQTGIMNTLDNGSLILFGTTTKFGFLLDTVFVIKSNESAEIVRNTNGSGYSQTYKEETLDQLCEYLKVPYCPNNNIKLYRGQTLGECNNYYSYVPCREEVKGPFNKVLLNYKSFPWLSKCTQGHPYKHLIGRDPINIWNDITRFLLGQKFYLGIQFEEPPIYTNSASGLSPNSNLQTHNPPHQKCC
jgi:hypothetical protein